MLFHILFFSATTTLCACQQLLIPARNGSSVISFSEPKVITGNFDGYNHEFDRGRPCNTDADTPDENAVFILEDGATLSNVIIGPNQLEGIHCLGSCTLKNTWFRDVCEGEFLLAVDF